MRGAHSPTRRREAVKLRLNANIVPEIQDGKPVHVHDDGKEVAIDVPAMQLRIGQLNEEARNHRLKAKDATGKLAGFEGIDAAAATRKAPAIVKDLEDKKLIDAGEAGKVKAEIKATYETLKAAEARSQSGVAHTGRSAWRPTMAAPLRNCNGPQTPDHCPEWCSHTLLRVTQPHVWWTPDLRHTH